MNAALPSAFADLEPLVPHWAVTGMQQRLRLRTESTPAERAAFYGAMAPRARTILDYLDAQSLDDLPPESERLLSLMLTLAEISLAEEVIGAATEPVHAEGNRVMRIDKELDGR